MKRIIYIFSAIFIIICIALSVSSLVSERVSETSLLSTKLGKPISHERFKAQNIQVAVKKIESGSFSPSDFSSSSWEYVRVNFDPSSENKKILHLPDNLQIGEGVKNSESDTKKLLNILPLAFIQELSDKSVSLNDALTLHSPGNNGLLYSDAKGVSEGKIESGWNAIFQNEDFLKYVYISNQTHSISVDTVNKSSLISSKIMNLSSSLKDENGSYTAEYGQSISYSITVDKSLLKNDTSLRIDTPANLVVDTISQAFDYQANDLSTAYMGVLDKGVTVPDKLSFAYQAVEDALDTTSTSYITVALPASDSNATFTVTAHIEPDVQVPTSILLNQADATSLTIDKKAFIPNRDVNSRTAQGIFKNFSLTLSVDDAIGQKVTNQTPPVGSSGINFLLMDTKKNNPSTGAAFILGKKIANKNYYWVGKDQWIELDGDLKDFDFSGVRQLIGGKSYIMGLENPEDLLGNNSKWSYSSKDKRISNSSIQILGLAQGSDYFLYQVKAAKGYSQNFKQSDFSVYRNSSVTSLTKAKNQDFNANLLLPSYQAGENEYNVLSVNAGTKSAGASSMRVIVSIILFIIVLVVLAGILLYIN